MTADQPGKGVQLRLPASRQGQVSIFQRLLKAQLKDKQTNEHLHFILKGQKKILKANHI